MNKKICIKNITRNILIIISIITLLSVSTINVYALGIAPSKRIIDYNTNEQTITSRVINNNAQNLAVQISVSGELAKYVTIDNPILYIDSSEPEKEFTYTLRLPEGLMPGVYELRILISEFRGNLNSSNSVGGLLAVTQQLIINVDYTGLYAEGNISVLSTTSNDPIIATLNFNNKGTETIQSLTGTINIKDIQGKNIITRNLAEKNNILPKEIIQLDESIQLENPGAYIAEYDINYDGQSMTIIKGFTSGDYEIKVINTNVQNFRLGTTAKFNIDLLNSWNAPIDNVYGEITISDMNNTLIGTTNITKVRISPAKDSVVAYWDTANIRAGEYLLKVNLRVGDKVITQEYKSIITENTIQIESTSAKKGLSGSQYYIITSATLILWATILILLLLKNVKKQKPYK
jgi:hypothetical protein